MAAQIQVKPGEIGKAPFVAPFPGDLPLADTKPDGTTCLPPETSEHVLKRLMLLEAYPKMCQVSIDLYGDYMAREAAQYYENKQDELRE